MTGPRESDLHGWWLDVICKIGQTYAGSFYCVNVCSEHYYDGKCDEVTSDEELAAYKEFRKTQPTKRRREESDDDDLRSMP